MTEQLESERVELQSDTDDRDSSVKEGGTRSGSEGTDGFKGLSPRLNSFRVGGLVLRLWPPVLWKKPSQRGLMFSSGWVSDSRLKPSPTAASRAPQPSRTSSERLAEPGLFLLGGVSGTWALGQYSPPSPSGGWVSLWKGMQR